MDKLKIWRETVKEYCNEHGVPFRVPAKGTECYDEIRKRYQKKIDSMSTQK